MTRRRRYPEAIVPIRNRSGQGASHLDEYVVTVRQDHHYVVKGRSESHASSRAIEEQKRQWGGGLRPEVTEVEKLP